MPHDPAEPGVAPEPGTGRGAPGSAAAADPAAAPEPHRTVSRWSLAAIVTGSMLGAGVFSLPRTFAGSTGVVGSLVAWAVAGTGMLMLALVFQRLAAQRPDLDAGVYAYARAGFGRYLGFLSALGYWAAATMGNVVYWVLICATLSRWFPALGDGGTPAALLVSSVGLWLFWALVVRGVTSATAVNRVVTVAKTVPLVVFVVVVALAFDPRVFAANLWGPSGGWSGLLPEVRGTLLLTVFAFLGVEGASVYSRYARRRRDVGWATLTGFGSVLALFVLVTMVGFGVMPRERIAALGQPSVAGVLEDVVGGWGATFVGIGVIVCVLGAYLAWTLMAAEVIHSAALRGDMPRALARINARGGPWAAVTMTTVTAQVFLVLAASADDAFDTAIAITSSLSLVPYLLAAAFAVKLEATERGHRARALVVASLALVYTVFLVWAGGVTYLLVSTIVYSLGTVLYVLTRYEQGEPRWFTRWEALLCVLVVAAGVTGAVLLASGRIELG
ncbi:basic amino acid/polyamine antiporter [Cellulomonas sp. HZM]|uniref:basic amino acid/polyamine antiporter n=1 Tax=Cellulomonas sp. HZM TaxID=1454010 RepID=UPI0009DD3188|nr:basic amino acid/polyamine antiporter [Cellulomonas sp. HZM]